MSLCVVVGDVDHEPLPYRERLLRVESFHVECRSGNLVEFDNLADAKRYLDTFGHVRVVRARDGVHMTRPRAHLSAAEEARLLALMAR